MGEFKTLENGVKMAYTTNNVLLHECNFCGTYFTPRRRFMQKFCSDSCRVMSCRKRKEEMLGLTGGYFLDKRKSFVTNKELKDEIYYLKLKLDGLTSQIEENGKMSAKINNKQIEAIENVSSKLTINTWISGLSPLLSPILIDKLKSIFQAKKKLDLNSIMSEINPILEKLPDDVRINIMQQLVSFYPNK